MTAGTRANAKPIMAIGITGWTFVNPSIGKAGTSSVKLQGPSRARRATASSNGGLSAVRHATISTRAERYGGTMASL